MSDFEWNDYQCANRRRFMCNSCEGKLDKYMLYDINAYSKWDEADTLCKNDLNTSLASIHSNDDNAIARHLCNASEAQNMWIGLRRNSTGSDIFYWSDGTDWNYGIDTSGGIFPWDSIYDEPNNNKGGEECVVIEGARNNS